MDDKLIKYDPVWGFIIGEFVYIPASEFMMGSKNGWGSRCVTCGGGRSCAAKYCRSASRLSEATGYRYNYVGFRRQNT